MLKNSLLILVLFFLKFLKFAVSVLSGIVAIALIVGIIYGGYLLGIWWVDVIRNML